MAFDDDVFLALSSDTVVSQSVGNRIFPTVLPQEQKDYPALVYFVVTTVPQFHMRGSSNKDSVRIQIDTWSKKYSEAKSIAANVRRVVEAINGITVESAYEYEPETKLHRVLQQFNRMSNV